MRRLLLLPVAVALLGAAKYDPVPAERLRQDSIDYQEVSLVRILANPELYDGKLVQASGYLTLGFEDSGLHLDKTAYDAGLTKNAVWVSKPSWLSRAQRARLTNRYATVYARFNASHEGMYSLYSGSLEDVRRIRPKYGSADFQDYMFRMRNEAFRQMMLPALIVTILIGALTAVIAGVLIRRMNNR